MTPTFTEKAHAIVLYVIDIDDCGEYYLNASPAKIIERIASALEAEYERGFKDGSAVMTPQDKERTTIDRSWKDDRGPTC